MATVASPLRQFYEWSTRDSGRAVALSWHPAPPQPVRRWSYRRLWLAAVGAAAKLRSRGAVPSDSGRASSGTIGVAVDEGVELVVAFLAVALAGAAIVPFSGSDPPARIASILRDADCRAVVVDSRRDRAATARVEEAARQSGRALTLVEADELVRQLSAEGGIETDEDRGPAFYDADANANAWDPDPDPRRVSHVAFTSGSAGKPRGCVCTHESLAHYCHGKNTTMGVRPDSTVLLASAHTFDPCLGDVFATLAAGATLALAPRARLAESLGSCLFESGATHALTTPTMLGSVCADQIKRIGADRTLEVLALGGEPMSQTLANAWLPNVKCLANAYGLTECGVYQTFSRVEHVCDADRIGDPIGPGCRLLVAELRDGGDGDGDAEFGAADAADAAALLQALAPVHRLRSDEKERLLELWIAGPQVGIGYARDAAATARRFFVDARTNERFFRTGDLVRVEDAPESSAAEKKKMCLRFAGRREAREFKLNGRRVDAREIEKAVLSSGLVSSCACVVSESDAGDGVLTAHVVLRDDDPNKETDPSSKDGNRSWGEAFPASASTRRLDDCARVALETHAGCHLPPATCPRRFVAWSAFPKTASGKLDRARLARASARMAPVWASSQTLDAEDVYLRREKKPAPGTTARLVADVWGETLGIDSSSIGFSDEFGALGGNSVSALRASRMLRARLAEVRAAETRGLFLSDEKSKAREKSGGFETDFPDADAGPGLREGEAAALFREEEDRACAFDAVAGPLSPAELLRRPTLAAYASFLDAGGLGVFGDKNAPGDETSDDGFFPGGARSRELAALFQACAAGRADVARALLRAGVDPNPAWARDGFAPLHVAAAGGASEENKIAVVEALLGAGADARALTAAGTSAAHLAAARGERALLEVLLVRGCDPAYADADKQTVAHLAARRGAFGAAETAALACAPLRTARGGLESWDAWRRTPADWALANGASDALLALRDGGARVRELASRVASAAAATRAKAFARDVSDWKTAKETSVLATLVAEMRRFPVSDVSDATLRDANALESLESEISAAGRAAATLKALVCANAHNRDTARALGATAPLVAMVASVASCSPFFVSEKGDPRVYEKAFSALHEARVRVAIDAAGALRNLAYANPANRAAAIAAGAAEALEAASRACGASLASAAPDGPRRRLAFVSASALANLKT
jgi:acyl-CoA synthetase (AMP-forming)/AMP-acid ligase II